MIKALVFMLCKTNYYYHLSSTIAKAKSLNQSNFLFIIHFNIRSLKNNFDKLHYHISNLDYQPDIIALTEWFLLFGEFSSVKSVAGNNSAIFSQYLRRIHLVSKK